MSFKSIEVGIEADAIEKISANVKVEQAIEELIWNAIDAEAFSIDVKFERNEIDGITKITVSDDGHGIAVVDAEKIFGNIGGSLKRLCRRSPKLDRPYHGKDGEGRYKAFALGRHVQWQSRVLEDGSVLAFSVAIDTSCLKSAKIGEPCTSTDDHGCDVIITDLRDEVSGLRNPTRRASTVHKLAPFLMANPSIRIVYDNEVLDVRSAVNRDETIPVEDECGEDATPLSFELRVLEWNKPRKGSLFWCDEHGVSFHETPLDMKEVRFPYSAYVLSDTVRELHGSGGLGLDRLNPVVKRIKDLARENLRHYFRRRQAEEAKEVACKIREDGLYPYAGVPTTPIDKAQQQVFDICAATVHAYLPQFERSDKGSRKFTYRLLRESLESSPTNLGQIFREVLGLSEEQQEDLLHLLGKTSLGAIICTAKTVGDRLAFINGLEQIIHSKSIRRHLKERSQLHRILAEELWLFGDEFALGGDDVALKTALAEHRKVLGLPQLDAQVVSEITDLDDVPDLLLWRKYSRGRRDEYENLVIELKRPTANINQVHLSQVKRYATKVQGSKHFDKSKTRWTFIALSDGIAEDAAIDINQTNRETGHVTCNPHLDVWALTWEQVIHNAKIRLQWIQDQLQLEVSDNSEGMQYLRGRFSHLLPDEANADEAECSAASH